MRLILASTALAMVAMPAVAQPRDAGDIARRLNDPVVQEGVASAMSTIAGIVLDTRIGPLARYSDGRVHPNDTLRDVKRRDDPYFEERLHDDTRRAVRGAGAMASDGAAMAGELARTAARLQAALAPFVDYAGDRARDYYRGDDGY